MKCKNNDADVVFCSYMNYYEQYSEFDAFITSPEPSNPWTSDNVEFWEQELSTYVFPAVCLHGDSAGNTVEENSNIFSLIECASCLQ